MPFKVEAIGDKVHVAYSQFDGMEEVEQPGHGVVAVFAMEGCSLRKLAVGTDRGGPLWQLTPLGFRDRVRRLRPLQRRPARGQLPRRGDQRLPPAHG